MKTQSTKRLYKTLTGHYYELQAVFSRTAAHKLPSAMGALREDAVARFITAWIPKRYSSPTNVFAITRQGKEFPAELDLVVHDSNSGALWHLDAQGGNSIVTWEEIRLVAQIKSKLDDKEFEKACNSMSGFADFAVAEKTDCPFRVLFAYKVEEGFLPLLLEKFTHNQSDTFPFDAFILLDHGAYFSDTLRELRVGIEKGLSPNRVQNDGPSQDILVSEDCIESRIPCGYRGVADCTPESALLSLAALATLAASGDDATQVLLAACMHSEHFPIFE